MIEKYLNNRFLILYLIPFTIGIFSVFSFQPFNLTFLNFFILPIFFYLTVFIKKNQKTPIEKNRIKKIYLYLEQLLVLVSSWAQSIGLQIHYLLMKILNF